MKTYACPFCGTKLIRDKLTKHIEKEHDDEVPENYTAYRLVYDIVNDKHGHGNCTICGKPTKWNEKRQKYERLCGDPKCYAEVKKTYQKRIMKVYNKTSLMDDPKHLEKMLAGRKISGKYKWSDGKVFTYTGSYEKQLLEFLDKVLEYKSDEIVAPGPVLEYEYKGKKHMWITDLIILPYNLIIEVKDGEDNPNKRYMPVYREKQVYKEKMITNLGTYSYLRLTNNDFGQLLGILAELKMQVVDNDKNLPLYRIHEALEENKNKMDVTQEALQLYGLQYEMLTEDKIGQEDHYNEYTGLNESNYRAPILFSDDDIVIDFDKWENGEINYLYIYGNSGSGKSTLAEKISQKYHVKTIELDCFDNPVYYSNEKLLFDYIKDQGYTPKEWLNKWETYAEKCKAENKLAIDYADGVADFILYVQKRLKRAIFEGIQIPWVYKTHKEDIFKKDNFALIVKGTSLTTSFVRRRKRDGFKFINFPLFIKTLYGFHKENNEFRKNLIDDGILKDDRRFHL